ncbi:hypothetical protein [Haemophilus parahaemolyticus]
MSSLSLFRIDLLCDNGASGRFVDLIYTRFDMMYFLFLSGIYGILVVMSMAF